jgi:hypothetical protein
MLCVLPGAEARLRNPCESVFIRGPDRSGRGGPAPGSVGIGPAKRRFSGPPPPYARGNIVRMKGADFESIHNHYERAVFEEVLAQAAVRAVEARLLADIACVALNQLPPRYIRHDVDFNFYLTSAEREQNAQLVRDAVSYAFDFVVARTRMKLPRNGPQTAVVTRVARRLVARSRAGR